MEVGQGWHVIIYQVGWQKKNRPKGEGMDRNHPRLVWNWWKSSWNTVSQPAEILPESRCRMTAALSKSVRFFCFGTVGVKRLLGGGLKLGWWFWPTSAGGKRCFRWATSKKPVPHVVHQCGVTKEKKSGKEYDWAELCRNLSLSILY